MVDVITSASATANINALNQIAKAREAAKKAVAEFEAQKQEKIDNKNLQGPSGAVTELEKTVSKSSSNLQVFATDIGTLVKNTSRLNVISTLAEGDRQDYYKFTATNTGKAAFSQLGDPDLRIQLRKSDGTLVADSNEDSDDKYENFIALQKGEFELEAGQYAISVARKEEATAEEKLNFALQLRMGDYSQDFDTVVKQPDSDDDPLNAQTNELTNMLTQGLYTISDFQFGQSGTDKLMGVFNSGALLSTVI